MELNKVLTTIWNLEEAINETEKQNSLKERIILENGKFTAISKNSSKIHTLAPLLQDIRSTLDQAIENLANSNGNETELFRIAALEREIYHIKNWEEKAVNSFYKSHSKLGRNILHYIPFSRWREAWLNADRISKEHEQIQQKINEIQSQCIATRLKIAQQKFQTFKNSIEEKKN